MSRSEPVRVLVVDDSAFMRRAVERMLSDSPAIQVAATAANGEDAVTLACELGPDVIVMDVNMPRMDGLEALRHIMERCPAPVLMMSTLTRAGAAVTMRALELGAVDFIDKSAAGSAMDIYRLAPLLRDKVLTISNAEIGGTASITIEPPALEPEPPEEDPATAPAAPYAVVAIGASTGGPKALTEILPRLPADFGAGIVVAQHMPAGFTSTLAERLDERCALRVREARDGDAISPGLVLVAPGGEQMLVERSGDVLLTRIGPGPADVLHHPSVDLLFASVAEATGERGIGVVLTGMGQDGAEGLRAMRNAGARTLAESAQTAVVYGMPRAARDAAERVLRLERIAPVLTQWCGRDAASRRRP